MSVTCTTDFSNVFRTRREYCRALLEMSGQQFELVEQNDYAALLDLLGRKQRLLSRLDEQSRTSGNLWALWHHQRAHLTLEEQSECDVILAESEDLLAQALKHEKAGTDLLTERRNATQRELETIAQGAQAHQAYNDDALGATHRHLNVNQ